MNNKIKLVLMSPQVHLFSLLSRNVSQGPVVFIIRIGCTIKASSTPWYWDILLIVSPQSPPDSVFADADEDADTFSQLIHRFGRTCRSLAHPQVLWNIQIHPFNSTSGLGSHICHHHRWQFVTRVPQNLQILHHFLSSKENSQALSLPIPRF